MTADVIRANRSVSEPEAVVLCVDEADRDVIAFWLAESNIRTVVAADGYEAGSIMAAGNTRLLVTDRVLPPWPGLATFRELKKANVGLRVAVIEDGIPDSRIIAKITGADLLLSKPLKRHAIVEAAKVPAMKAG
jgi:DNA-binding response OmpR family regulator